VYVHGHDEQLFDLDADPGEWTNVASDEPEVADELRAAILARFDPDAIAAHGEASVRRRDLIRRANARNGTRWDYVPTFDATKQYVR
jgi:choline-sulfatase